MGKTDPSQVFPEYYVIKVNQFNDIAKDSLDEWIYYLKNNEIRDEFHARGIDKARDLWRMDKLSYEDQKNYDRHLEDLRYGASMAWSMKVDAEYRIRDDERKKEKLKIAVSLRNKGFGSQDISEITGLTIDELEEQ